MLSKLPSKSGLGLGGADLAASDPDFRTGGAGREISSEQVHSGTRDKSRAGRAAIAGGKNVDLSGGRVDDRACNQTGTEIDLCGLGDGSRWS